MLTLAFQQSPQDAQHSARSTCTGQTTPSSECIRGGRSNTVVAPHSATPAFENRTEKRLQAVEARRAISRPIGEPGGHAVYPNTCSNGNIRSHRLHLFA